LEHLAATSLLPLARISKFFVVVNYMPNTPVGSLDVKTNKSIKVKVQLGFPQKTKSPSGATAGGTIFSQKVRECAKYDSTLASSEFRRGASGQAGRTCEPEIAYASARIWPFSLASGPAGHSRNRTSPTRIHPGKRKNGTVRQAKQETPLTHKSV
jgi:hypothetical protein